VLSSQAGQTSFKNGPAAATAGFNQGYLGPTIVTQDGGLDIKVTNQLAEMITVHWHGMLVPGIHDGAGHSPIEPGKTWAIDMQIGQKPNMAWYHSHPHGSTARHVYSGLAGVIHHTDGRDDQRGLPSTYGVDDLTLVIQDRRFDSSGRMVYNPDTTDILNGFQGERILINGQYDAYAKVPKGLVRLRFLNGSNAKFYSLYFSDQRPMHLFATDGGFLPKPVELTYMRIAPGERMEVLVDFSGGDDPVLMSSNGLRTKILDFVRDETMQSRIARLPEKLDAEEPFIPTGSITTRRFGLNMGGSATGMVKTGGAEQGGSGHAGHAGHISNASLIGAGPDGKLEGIAMNDFGINGRSYDAHRIDFTVPMGTYEKWTITGGAAGVEHPFHVHGVRFRVLSVSGGPPRPEDSGWKDLITVNGDTQILVKFDHPASREAPYMYHCHILEHEDSGMMGQFMVA
jgi:FtsP/CotA-like multicopper oxidase with cupredoxin domain